MCYKAWHNVMYNWMLAIKTEEELVASWSWMMNCEEEKKEVGEGVVVKFFFFYAFILFPPKRSFIQVSLDSMLHPLACVLVSFHYTVSKKYP